MAGDRRHEIEIELAAWRAAERRQDTARPGSSEYRLAAIAAAEHQRNFRRLTNVSAVATPTTSK
jgi:hypothetical protein